MVLFGTKSSATKKKSAAAGTLHRVQGVGFPQLSRINRRGKLIHALTGTTAKNRFQLRATIVSEEICQAVRFIRMIFKLMLSNPKN
jgi:hypothetical protein